MIHILSS